MRYVNLPSLEAGASSRFGLARSLHTFIFSWHRDYYEAAVLTESTKLLQAFRVWSPRLQAQAPAAQASK